MNNKTFDAVDYSTLINFQQTQDDIAIKNYDESENELNTDIDELRIMFFFYHIMMNIDNILDKSPEQIMIVKQNPLYLSLSDIYDDEKIATASTLAFILNLYYFMGK